MTACDHRFQLAWASVIVVCLSVATMASMGASGCDRHLGKEQGQSGAASNAGPSASMGPSHRAGAQGGMAARAGSSTSVQGAASANASGPDSATGLAVCDQYLRAVCRCSARRPALKEVCAQAKQSAPQWKATSAKDPVQRTSVQASCTKALKALTETFHCPADAQ